MYFIPAAVLISVFILLGCLEVTTSQDRATPEPIDPEEIEVNVNYEPDPTDLVLSSVPGGELFDPRKHRFSEEELKPQPMIKKAKKVFVPEGQKVRCGREEDMNMHVGPCDFYKLFSVLYI